MIPPLPDLFGVDVYVGTFPPVLPEPRYTVGPLLRGLPSTGLTVVPNPVVDGCEPLNTVGPFVLLVFPSVGLVVERKSCASGFAPPRNTVGPFSRGREVSRVPPGLSPFSKSGRVPDSA